MPKKLPVGRPTAKPPTKLAARFRAARKARGLTLASAAKSVGLHTSTVARIEADGNVPTFPVGLLLARLYGVDPQALAFGRAIVEVAALPPEA
jgi:transcriptional regulator with XRE-family HTH domain